MIAWDGDEIAGFSQNRYRGALAGLARWESAAHGASVDWVKPCCSTRSAEFYKRGTTTIGLGVDAQNPTGATRLYQKVGMHAVSEFVFTKKNCAPAVKLIRIEIATESRRLRENH